MKIVYQCEKCSTTHKLKSFIFVCLDCGQEICDHCMRGWQTCKKCGSGKTDKELEERFNEIENLYG